VYREIRFRLIAGVLIAAFAMILSGTAAVCGAEGELSSGPPGSMEREQGRLAAEPYVDLIGRLNYGPCRAVAVDGERIYFGNGYSMEVFARGGPPPYSRMGTIPLPSAPRDIEVSGEYVYLSFEAIHPRTGYNGLYVIDVSDPYNPITVGSWAADGGIIGMALRGDHLYAAASGERRFYVIDVSDPANPTPESFLETDGYPYNVTLSDNHAFVAEGGNWPEVDQCLEIIDITDPLNPAPVAEASAMANLMDVALFGDYAFAASSDCMYEAYDVSDPVNPGYGGVGLPLMAGTSIEMNGPYMYVTNFRTKVPPSGLAMYDFSAYPGSVPPLETYGIPGRPEHLVIRDNTAFIANAEMGLHVLDLTDPMAPVEAWRQVTGGRSHGIALSGSYAFVADDVAGLRVIDASDQTAPVMCGSYFTGNGARDIAINGNHAYLVDDEGKLRVVDISDPSHLIETASIETAGDARRVAVSESYAYIADMEFGLRIIDVGDPGNPVEVGIYEIEQGCYAVDVAGDFAYIRPEYPDVELSIIDISDKSNPHKVGAYDGSISYGIHATSDYVYITFASLGPAGVSVIDVTDPANPFEAGRLEWDDGYPMWGITVHGGLAYVADENYGLRIVDISDPADPVMVGGHPTDDIPSDVAISSNDGIFVVDRYDGLYIFASQLVATLLRSYDAALGDGSVIVRWELSEPLAASCFGIERRSLPAGSYVPMGNPVIEREGARYTYRDSECEPGTTYRYRIEIDEGDGTRVLFETDPVSTPAASLTLEQNHPNPFNPSTVIRFDLPYREHVTLDVYDVNGRWITRLVNGVRESGPHAVSWSGKNERGEAVSSGLYFYLLRAGKESVSRKMILLR
jgi:hypothetical protein